MCNNMKPKNIANLRILQILEEDKATLNVLKSVKAKISIITAYLVFCHTQLSGVDNSENGNHDLKQ